MSDNENKPEVPQEMPMDCEETKGVIVLCPYCKADLTEAGPVTVTKHLCGECCIGDWG